MLLQLCGEGLSIESLQAIAVEGVKVALAPEAIERIQRCRAFIEAKMASGATMYGVNTGVGDLSEVRLSEGDVKDFQRHLIYTHAAGVGTPFPSAWVRAAMVSRINVHAKGCSACRLEVPQMLVDMLNRGVTPVVPRKGSVGACGDLAPMSHIALGMIGEGEALLDGVQMPAARALEKAGLVPLDLQARDGLAMINGANFLTAIGGLFVHQASSWLLHAEVAASMSLEALHANLGPYDARIHELRGFAGSCLSAANLRRLLAGSELEDGTIPVRLQDAYSMRSTPQILGTLRDQLRWTRQQVEIELNGLGDNPIFLADQDQVLSGANFQGTPVSVPVDNAGSAVAMACVLSERRLNRMLHPALSNGLPAFLASKPGLYSGLMIPQYTADMLIAEQRILSTPAYIQSIPAAADQEDFVSMGMNSSQKAMQILENAQQILAVEFMAATQALDFRKHRFGRGVAAAHASVRQILDTFNDDRPVGPDIQTLAEVIQQGTILDAAESEAGRLAR